VFAFSWKPRSNQLFPSAAEDSMTGFDLERVRDTLADAFDDQAFDELLLFKLNIDRAKIVKDDALNTVVLNVLRKASQEGWDALLLVKAAEVRPRRPDVQALARKYAVGLVSEFRSQAGANKYVRMAYRDFNLVPPGFPTEEQLGRLEKTIDSTNPMFNMRDWIDRAAKIEGHVCRFEIDGSALGTGFLVGPDVVLTNHHVVESAITDQTRMRVRFDFKQLRDGTILSGTLVEVKQILDACPCTPGEASGQPEATDPDSDHLDFALVRLRGRPGSEPISVAGAAATAIPRGWVSLPDVASTSLVDPFATDAPLLIAQHPQGEPLRLAIEWKSVVGVNRTRTRLKHRTNTLAGSSGSPCFDRNWNLIALHHYGDPGWVSNPAFNQAVPIGAIKARLLRIGLGNCLGGNCD
jgi:hypothetical protein